MRRIIITSLFLLSAAWLQAQTVVIEETVEKDPKVAVKKKNLDFGVIWDITFYGGADQKGIAGTLANSTGFNFMLNAKYKFNKHLRAIGYLAYNLENYGFKKTAENDSFPNANKNDVEKYSLQALSGGLGLRFTTTKKAYLELGAFAKWNFVRDLYIENKDVNDNVNEITIKDLNYINKINYDAYARLGYKVISLVAYYRLNNMFSTSNIAPEVYEMPRLRLGVSLGF